MTISAPLRDHGGNLDAAIARFGGAAEQWLDLSTGINPTAWPVPEIAAESWAVLPRQSAMARLRKAAQQVCQTTTQVIPFNGAQGAIQLIPYLRAPGLARVISPTYNEHAAALRTGGWQVEAVDSATGLSGADLAVIVNPNNPDGRTWSPDSLAEIAAQTGILIVDESFADPMPQLSLAPRLAELAQNIVVLRSFGKFYGLAGLRLGFALARDPWAARLSALAGPWPVSGPAIDIACAALSDRDWQARMITSLIADAARLDRLALGFGWSLVGGTPLFRTYAAQDAEAAQAHLAAHRIWSRIFPYSRHWIRLGLPAADRWHQLEAALSA